MAEIRFPVPPARLTVSKRTATEQKNWRSTKENHNSTPLEDGLECLAGR